MPVLTYEVTLSYQHPVMFSTTTVGTREQLDSLLNQVLDQLGDGILVGIGISIKIFPFQVERVEEK